MALSETGFPPIPAHRFEAFHRAFHGDTWDVCARCGGQCEVNKIGSLMPGEAEYISERRGEDPADFRARYLDGIETEYGLVDVLKLKPGCPFLSADFRCTIPDVKVVLCDVYPVVFEVSEGSVIYTLDPWCPIVRFVPELAATFEREAIPALQALDPPLPWLAAVASYDSLCVDYHKLFELRAARPDEYAVLTLAQVEQCLADEAPPPSLTPPAEPSRLPVLPK